MELDKIYSFDAANKRISLLSQILATRSKSKTVLVSVDAYMMSSMVLSRKLI